MYNHMCRLNRQLRCWRWFIIAHIINCDSGQIAASGSVCAGEFQRNICVFSYLRQRSFFSDCDFGTIQKNRKVVIIIAGYGNRSALNIRGCRNVKDSSGGYLGVIAARSAGTRRKFSQSSIDLDSVKFADVSLEIRTFDRAAFGESQILSVAVTSGVPKSLSEA